ncbi:MAG: winged helix-turn-helix domain-containing protein [Gammaproteobacteria bacterium]|nr:winged helix-turn-helix domain-containing protein [Gammaproteobacteria bacterium]
MATQDPESPERYQIGDLTLEVDTFRVLRDGQEVSLPKLSYQLLTVLARHAPEVVTIDTLMDEVWPGLVVNPETVTQRVKLVRDAIGDDSKHPSYIALVRGRGYRLIPPAEQIGMPQAERHGSNPIAPQSRRPIATILLLTIALVAILAVYSITNQPAVQRIETRTTPSPNSVAVLPFANLSPNPDDAFFAAGMHEEVINALANLRDVHVIARTSMLQFAGSDMTISEIADQLNVESVMEGSIRYADQRVRVVAQLIDPASGGHLWSQAYERDLADIFAIQSDIASRIATALEAELSPVEQRRIARAPTESPEAFTYFLQAQAIMKEGATAVSESAAKRADIQSYLDQAIALDPDFASAYAQKAYVFSWSLAFDENPPKRSAELEALITKHAQTALALDPTLGLAHTALARLHQLHWRWPETRTAFERALELNPNDPYTLNYYAWFRMYMGEYAEAIESARRALEYDPYNALAYDTLATAYVFARDFDAAAETAGKGIEIRPALGITYLRLAIAEAGRGNRAEAQNALEVLERLLPDDVFPGLLANLAYAYSRIGQLDDAERIVADVGQMLPARYIQPAARAWLELATGNSGGAIDRLRSALDLRAAGDVYPLVSIRVNVWRDPILEEPEFVAIRDELSFSD